MSDNTQDKPTFGFKAIVNLAWPTAVTGLTATLIQLSSLKILSPLGDSVIAGLTTGNRFLWMAQAMATAISAGAVALAARSWGTRGRREAARTITTATLLTLSLGLVLSVLFYLGAEPASSLFLSTPEDIEQSKRFIETSAYWLPFLVLNFVFSSVLRAVGSVLLPLFAALAMALVTVPLIYGLSFGYWGLPQLGIEGAAAANGIGMFVSCLMMITAWTIHQIQLPTLSYMPAILHIRTLTLIKIGIPAASEQLIVHGGLSGFLIIVGFYGTAPYVAYGIGVSILSISFLIGFGFSIAASTIVGQSLGMRDKASAVSNGWRTTGLSLTCMSILGALVILMRWPLANFFSPSAEVAAHTVQFIWCLGLMQPLMAIEFTLRGALQGAGDTTSPFIITCIGLVGVRVPLALLFWYLDLSVVWVYAALILDYVVKAILFCYWFSKERWAKLGYVRG